METQKKWYQQTGWVIALCILFFPVGLFLLWKNPFMSKSLKWIVFGCWLVLMGVSAAKTDYSEVGKHRSSNISEGNDDVCCCTYLDNNGKVKHKRMSTQNCFNKGGKAEWGKNDSKCDYCDDYKHNH